MLLHVFLNTFKDALFSFIYFAAKKLDFLNFGGILLRKWNSK